MGAVHPWHDVSLGPQKPEFVLSIIEIPRGSKALQVIRDAIVLDNTHRDLLRAGRQP